MYSYYSPSKKVFSLKIQNDKAIAIEKEITNNIAYDPTNGEDDIVKGVFKWDQFREYETGTVVEYANNLYILVGQPEPNGSASKEYVVKTLIQNTEKEEPSIHVCGCNCKMTHKEHDDFLAGANYKIQKTYNSFKNPAESSVWKKVQLTTDEDTPRNAVVLHSLGNKKIIIEVI